MILPQGLRDTEKQHQRSEYRYRTEGKKRDAVVKVLNDLASKRSAERRPQSNRSGQSALCGIEASGATRAVRHDKHRDHSKDGVRDTVKQLNCDQAALVMCQRIEQRAKRQHSEA